MNKKGYSRPGFFGGMNHYDANGKKVGESRPGFFGGMNDYDANGKKIGHSSPSFFGGIYIIFITIGSFIVYENYADQRDIDFIYRGCM